MVPTNPSLSKWKEEKHRLVLPGRSSVCAR